MTKYTESEMFDVLHRLMKIYLESYPDDKEAIERFIRWAFTQYGYRYDR